MSCFCDRFSQGELAAHDRRHLLYEWVDQQRTLHINCMDDIDPLEASSKVDGSETDEDESSTIRCTVCGCDHHVNLTRLAPFQHSGVFVCTCEFLHARVHI